MSQIDADCPLCAGECVPWTCPNCGEPNCSFHEETCGACGFPRLHRARDLQRRTRLREGVDRIFTGWKKRESA